MSHRNPSHPDSSHFGGQHSQDTQQWLHRSVQAFFSTCNWEDCSINIRDIHWSALTPADLTSEPLALSLSVNQFFAAVDWDGSLKQGGMSQVTMPQIAMFQTAPEVEDLPATIESARTFTLTDFSDLF
jgi:hypothetical protein